jgi:hypothetical protein
MMSAMDMECEYSNIKWNSAFSRSERVKFQQTNVCCGYLYQRSCSMSADTVYEKVTVCDKPHQNKIEDPAIFKLCVVGLIAWLGALTALGWLIYGTYAVSYSTGYKAALGNVEVRRVDTIRDFKFKEDELRRAAFDALPKPHHHMDKWASDADGWHINQYMKSLRAPSPFAKLTDKELRDLKARNEQELKKPKTPHVDWADRIIGNIIRTTDIEIHKQYWPRLPAYLETKPSK